jgi:L-ascorbate metabolism protein UlaG (beta-lactamase superfamily)
MKFNRKNKVIFVGTGGGGSMVGHQIFSTGGMWWNINGVDFYVDPGPGTIWHLRKSLNKLSLPLAELKFVFISHKHLDHVNDLNALIETYFFDKVKLGLNQSILDIEEPKPRLILLAPEDVVDPQNGHAILTPYHRKMLLDIKVLGSQQSYPFGDLQLTTTKRLLEKPWYQDATEEYGFWLKTEDSSVGYLPETYWERGLLKGFHPKVLIYNSMLWTREKDREAMIKTIKEIKPKLVVLRHWIRRAVDYGIEKIAKELAIETSIETLVATDFSILDLRKRKLTPKL